MSEEARGSWLRPGPGRVIVLSGPSGVGKDTVLRVLFSKAPELKYSVSYTTRAPRPDERAGESYFFVDEGTFHRMAANREFLEYADVHCYWYGTSRSVVQAAVDRGQDIILKIDVQGAARVSARVEDALTIFLMPPSRAALWHRLETRYTEDNSSLARRREDAEAELAQAARYDHRVVNDDVERAALEILSLLYPERAATIVTAPQG